MAPFLAFIAQKFFLDLDADPDPSFDLDADPVPAFHSDTDLKHCMGG
jgi:hypothetical protein